jgi:hypothetical protein
MFFLHLTKYLCKFHSFLKVKNETLQSWHFRSSQIFHQLLHNKIMQKTYITS